MTKEGRAAERLQPAEPGKLHSELGRRRFLTGAIVGAGAAGMAAMLPAMLPAALSRDAAAGARATDMANAVPVSHEPVLIYVRDALSGEAVIMGSEGERVVIDHALVALLLRAEAHTQT